MKKQFYRLLSVLMACTLFLACFSTGYAAETLSAEDLAMEPFFLTDAEGKRLNQLCAAQAQAQQAKAHSSYQTIKARDWSKYTSKSLKNRLSSAERKFYERMDNACLAYLKQPDHYVKSGNYLCIAENINYADLGLSLEKAIDLYSWFRLNNPQYYFLDNSYSYNSTTMYLHIYDFVKQLGDEGKVTNQMFDKLDSWIADCNRSGQTAWQKVVSITRKITENIKYSPAVKAGDTSAVGGKNQTIYSVLMTSETVCAGYSKTFASMANALGVDAYSVKNDDHQWNIVQFDNGCYYTVDVCWDDRDDQGICDYDYIGLGSDAIANDTSHHYSQRYAHYAPSIPKASYCGYGRLELPNNTVFTGGWKDGGKQGYGIWTLPDGTTYEGFWKKDMLNGMGINIWAGGSYYYGDWANGMEDGYGVFTYPEGAMRSALWAKNNIVEHFRFETDTFSFSNGIYSGTVRNNHPNYYGKAEFNGGDTYIGYFTNGSMNGTGKYTWAGGYYYFGEWCDGKITGQGFRQFSNGNIYQGSFLDRKLDGQGKYIWANGDVYEGEWKNDLRHGNGWMRYNNGEVYIGEWKNDKRDGQGKYTWPNGQVYEGGWKNGKYDGYGTITSASGYQKSGQWRDGEFIG